VKIISWNVNGFRSVYKKGFLEWLTESNADIVCLQEIKAHEEQLPFDLTKLTNYYSYFNPAKKKGYSGVVVFSKSEPRGVKREIGTKRFDSEGRFLQLEYKDFILLNLYLPHGGRKKDNLNYKLHTYDFLLDYLDDIKERKIILAGDFNVAHQEIDLARPQQNKDNVMFTAEERQKIDSLTELGFSDSFRKFNQKGGNYSWWPYGNHARERNIGWRIDYIFTSESLTSRLTGAAISPEVTGSDHCPIEAVLS
jgi:exodeoxyribonuclease-3